MNQLPIDWGQIITTVLIAIVPPLAAYLAARALVYAREFWRDFSVSNPDLAYELARAAELGVVAAEQLGYAGKISDKKQHALNIVDDYLKSQGLKVDVFLVDAAIEKAVFEEFNKAKTKAIP